MNRSGNSYSDGAGERRADQRRAGNALCDLNIVKRAYGSPIEEERIIGIRGGKPMSERPEMKERIV